MMIQVDADKVLAAIREFQREKQYTPAPSDIADMLRLPLPAVLVAIDTLIDRGIFKRGSWLVIQGPSPAPVVLASTERKPRRQSASPTEPTAHFDVFDACLPELSPECRERSRQRFLALREQYPYYDIGSFLSRERVAHGLSPDFPLADAG